MGYFNSRGLRGSTLEEMINMTNEMYRKKGIALIQKIPTPIKPVKFDTQKKLINLAYFEQKSTVDFIGALQGIPICFDAKETAGKSLPIANIHEHQIHFMKDFVGQGGIAFLLVYFSKLDEYYVLPFELLHTYWINKEKNGRKSIPYKAFEDSFKVENSNGLYLHYLPAVRSYYESKETKDE